MLNEILEQPTDENLARWLRERITVPGLLQVGIQSTLDEGVELDALEHAHVWRRYRFESAHFLPNVPAGHKCGRLHGHGFEVILHADQDVGARDLGVDYDHLDSLWAPLHAKLHHRCLNDIPGLENPTSEVIAGWVWQQLKYALPELSWVTCFETGTSGSHFDGRDYRIWKELTFDSAVRFLHAPADDSRARIHGHTFTLRLHLSAPLDSVMGWTIDFGDVKQLFDPLYKKLDHQPLHELTGVIDSDTASLARWIRQRAGDVLPALDRVDVYQTRGSGSLLTWGPNGPSLPV
jgi:6-pyruvoyltetrahydropterin/6-carboxytetrahydropterin synthase